MPPPDAPPSSRRFVGACARLAGDRRFEAFTMGVILLNAIVLGLETYGGIEARWGRTLGILNDVFLGYFVVEISIRIAGNGLRPWNYFRNGWNVFDFLIISAAFLPGVRENATILRVIRLLRVFRLVSLLPELRVLIVALGRSLAPLASMALLTVLLIYVYGMLGWVFFAEDDPERWGSVGKAMLTLFTVLTLEEWTIVMRDAMEVSAWAALYFVSFVLVSAFLLLNMVIAVVINSVEEARAAMLAQDRDVARDVLRQEEEHYANLLDRLDGLREALDVVEQEIGATSRRTKAAPARSRGRAGR